MAMSGVLTFPRVFGFTLVLLILSIAAVFTARGELAWCVGFIYLAYDTCLLASMVWLSRAALREEAAQPAAPAASSPTLTVLVPARNESAVLPACLDALLAEPDQPESIRVIDDGSEDDTVKMMAVRYAVGPGGRSAKHPNLVFWSKPSTGKARSFNELLPQCTEDLIVTIDADTVIEPGAIAAFRAAFAAEPRLAAACGVLRPRCRAGFASGYFEFFQRFEYLRAFVWRLAWSRLNALVLVSGAFAVYRRQVLAQIGGFDAESWVEDYELLYRLHRESAGENAGWLVRVIPGARAETDAPGRPGQFLRQRARWFGGFIGTLVGNRDMVGAPRFGGVGRRLLPVKTVDTLLPVFAATAQLSLIYLLLRGGFLNFIVLGVLAAKFLLDLCLHLQAMRLYARWLQLPAGKNLALSVVASVLEPFCFQPLRYCGALAGWLAYSRRQLTWESQRLDAAASK